MTNIHFNTDEGSKLKLFTPGPVHVPERILREMTKPNNTHRSKPYEELTLSDSKGMLKVLTDVISELWCVTDTPYRAASILTSSICLYKGVFL